jgi:hypothetical protein
MVLKQVMQRQFNGRGVYTSIELGGADKTGFGSPHTEYWIGK